MQTEGKFVNKVISDGEVLIDLTEDTVTSDTMLEGTIAHAANGAVIEGTIPNGEEMTFGTYPSNIVINNCNCESVYSLEETRIGTWIDGKPLYQKTFSIILPNTSSNTTIATLPNGAVIIEYRVVLTKTRSDGAYYYNVPFDKDVNIVVWFWEYRARCNVGNSEFYSCPGFLTVKYTKTTDKEVL